MSNFSSLLSNNTFGARKQKRRFLTASIIALAGALSVAPASAQDVEGVQAGDDAARLDTIIVTANKREQNLQDINGSVSAVTGETIDAFRLTDGGEVANFVAGVQLTNANGSQPLFQIRGIGASDFQVTTAPAAAVYLDGVFLGTNVQGGPFMFDQERVEILKGPQGTLYGRNASAGALNFISVRPTDEFEGYVSAGYGNADRLDFEAVLNIPISDTLATRISGRFFERDALIENVPNDDRFAPGPDTAGGTRDEFGIRWQALWTPSSSTNVLFNVHYAEDNGVNPNPAVVPWFQNPDPSFGVCPGRDDGSIKGNFNNPACVATDFEGQFTQPLADEFTISVGPDGILPSDNEFYGGFIELNHDFGWGVLTSQTAYEGFNQFYGFDVDATLDEALNLVYDRNLDQYSQEFRLAGSNEGADWLIGAYGSIENLDQFYTLQCGVFDFNTLTGSCNSLIAQALAVGAPFPPAESANNLVIWDREIVTYAFFTNNEIHLTDRLSLEIGARYTFLEETYKGTGEVVSRGGVRFLSNAGDLGSAEGKGVFEDKRITGNIGLSYDVTDDVLVYGRFAESFKGGGFDGNENPNVLPFLNPFESETVRLFELGFKGDFTNTFRLNGALFYQEYDKPQSRIDQSLTLPDGRQVISTALGNLEEADIFGVELEAFWSPLDGLDFGGTFSYLNTEITQSTNPEVPGLDIRYDGNELAQAPGIAASVFGRYETRISDMLGASIQSTISYTGDHNLRDENPGVTEIEAYTLISARLALFTLDDNNWELSVWGNNLLDEQYFNASYQSFGTDALFHGEPRTYGVEITKRF